MLNKGKIASLLPKRACGRWIFRFYDLRGTLLDYVLRLRTECCRSSVVVVVGICNSTCIVIEVCCI